MASTGDGNFAALQRIQCRRPESTFAGAYNPNTLSGVGNTYGYKSLGVS